VKRQAAVVALVACCPHKAAPAIIEQLFNNQYSMDQRFVMLNALALGAREIAQLPVPPSVVPENKLGFASKRLPPAKEARYLTMTDILSSPVQHLMIDISRDVVANSRDPSGSEPVQFARERQLRIRKSARITQLPTQPQPGHNALLALPIQKSRVPFTSVAAEYFIHPLISRFWSFLRDEQTREERTATLPRLHQYRSAGTGLIMSAPILSQFLATLGVLIHAAHNAPVWGAVLAPQALELALTLGSQKISLLDDEDRATEETRGPTEGQNIHASVLSASLELVLVILDGSLSLDHGRCLGLDHTQLLLSVGEWATKIFTSLDQGQLARGGGGAQEVRLLRSATGVCLKVEEISGIWRRSMIQLV
jgi:telomere length regulation protein